MCFIMFRSEVEVVPENILIKNLQIIDEHKPISTPSISQTSLSSRKNVCIQHILLFYQNCTFNTLMMYIVHYNMTRIIYLEHVNKKYDSQKQQTQ